MSGNLDRLEAEANRRREAFLASLAALTPRLSPARLADEAVKQADPDFRVLESLELSVRRNPVWALAALAGLWRLVGDTRPRAAPLPRRQRIRARPVSLATKETSNGNSQNSIR